MARSRDLATLIAEFDEPAALDVVRRRLARGEEPMALVDECSRGMRMVGQKYESGTYYLSALIMAGELLREILTMLQPLISTERRKAASRTMVMCTVKGDIHDIGKDIAAALLAAHGMRIIDLGTDVAPQRIADAVEEHQADVVGLSCLLTVFDNLKYSIEAIRERTASSGLHIPVIIGGAPLTQRVCDYAAADRWCTDASVGARLVLELLGAEHLSAGTQCT